MIQGFTESNITAYLSTEDNRIDTASATSKIRFLIKLINDMNGDVEYCYPSLPKSILPRYTQMLFTYNVAPDRYAGTINLLPAGHWKYEVYEVVWIGSVVVASGTAPANETDLLPVADTNGIVKGIVTKGILNLTEKIGTEQVQYNQHESTDSDNYVWYGTDIVVWNPADESSMLAWYKNKEGITLDSSGNVSEWADSSSKEVDMIQSTVKARPSYTESTGGVIFNPNEISDILASTEEIQLTGQFSVGFKIKAVVGATTPGILTSTSEASSIKLNGDTGVGLLPKTGVGVSLVTTKGKNADAYIVLTRNASNLVELNFNGVVEDSETMSGTLDLNEMGKTLDGSIFEIMVFDSTSPTLTDNINERLSNL